MNMRFEQGKCDGSHGIWLSAGGVRAFAVAEPYPRVTVFETNKHAAPLLPYQGAEYFGIRSWFLEPDQTENSGAPALLPAQIDCHAHVALSLRTDKDPASGLSLNMLVSIDPIEQSLTIHHSFRNETNRARMMAPWGIVAVTPGQRVGFTKWGTGARRAMILTAPARACDPTLFHGNHTLAVDFAASPEHECLKIGTDTDCGWVACADDDAALWVQTPFEPDTNYPEGGGTTTMFRSVSPVTGDMAEIETVGPLRSVGFGESMTLIQKLTMTDGLAGRTPDEMVSDLEQGTA